jgi:iron complex outermembrane receptor protein/hemoglobin/transferrin/lactoferrin receptor protein
MARAARAAVSYQRQHERRTFDRPGSFVRNGGRDDVDTLGLLLKATTAEIAPLQWASARVRWGGDAYLDLVDSRAWTEFTDIDAVIPLSRGQYLAGSSYVHGGGFVELEATLWRRLVARAGARAGAASASAPADPASGTAQVDRGWPVIAGNAGLEVQVVPALAVIGGYDRSFRAPNLDDLTSRQQSGPGFQFENPDLGPEAADTFEAGLRLTHEFVEADLWVFRSIVRDAIARAFRSIAECPPETPQCATSWARFQLTNAEGPSIIDGIELSARAWLPFGLTLRGTVAYARGEGPNPQARPQDPSIPYEERVPLSRVPPLNGTVEIRWEPHPMAYAGAGLRWAALQDRLAPTDRSDARIPLGGTPGYAVLDVRAGVRVERELIVSAVLENVLDAAYRVHGSSVNGPGRGIILSLEAGL